jgi:hypothetical protein
VFVLSVRQRQLDNAIPRSSTVVIGAPINTLRYERRTNTSDPMSNNSMARFIMIMVAIDIDGGADE